MSDDVPRCTYCLEAFASGVSCTVDDGRLRFGAEPDMGPDELNPDLNPDLEPEDVVCRDCGVTWGGVHHDACCVAVCGRCGAQMLGHTRRDCRRFRREECQRT